MDNSISYTYRGATIAATGEPNSEGQYNVFLEHPDIKGVSVFRGDTPEQAKQIAETALDELFASWN